MSDFPGFVKALADVGGWAAFAALAAVVIGLFVTGRIVPGSVVETQRAELEELRDMVRDDILEPVKEIGKGTATLVIGMQFLTDFVLPRRGASRRGGTPGERRDRT